MVDYGCHVASVPVDGFCGAASADDTKRRNKNGHKGDAELGLPQRRAERRKERSLTQRALCALVGRGITQLKREDQTEKDFCGTPCYERKTAGS
jgi:hypothetical protein